MNLDDLKARCHRPHADGPKSLDPIILCQDTQDMLKSFSGEHKQIAEIGSWVGFSALCLAKWNPEAIILCLDPWLGSCELVSMDQLEPKIAQSYDLFLANTAHLADRIWPLRMTGIDGLVVARERGFDPTLIFIDGSHQYESVWGDIQISRRLYPKAMIVLDDLNHPGVIKAVRELIPRTVINGYAGVFFP